MKTAHRKAARAKRIPLPLINPIQYAMAGAAKLTHAQVTTLMKVNHAAVHALQFGGFNEANWRALADAFNIAAALAKPPVNIANDHADKFDDAQGVLYALSEQRREHYSWTPRASQLQTVKDAMEMFEIQLMHVAQGEFEHTIDRLKRRMEQALRGNGNCRLVQMLP